MGEGGPFPALHYLLLDRQDRKAYIAQRDQTLILFALVEPEDGERHTVFVDGMLMSPGTESYILPPGTEFAHQLRSFLDGQLDPFRMKLNTR
jgi:hypothetical protein